MSKDDTKDDSKKVETKKASNKKTEAKKEKSNLVEKDEIEVFVVGLVLDPSTNAPIVVLKDVNSETCLPIWIGLAEATAIASALKKVEINRPMTHDLLNTVIEDLDAKVIKILISDLKDNTFIASVELETNKDKTGKSAATKERKLIDARPSDAIALAVRTSAVIAVKEKVLEQAKVTLVSVDAEQQEELGIMDPETNKPSGDFSNIDKEKWEEILAEMDPEDFKYKM